MAWLDILIAFLLKALQGLAEACAYMIEATLFILYGLWLGIVRFFLAIIEWADEQVPDLGVASNPLLRAAVTGSAGFLIAVLLVLLVALVTGQWWLNCLFLIVISFTVFVGVIADPDEEWDMGAFPRFRAGPKGPNIPLNL